MTATTPAADRRKLTTKELEVIFGVTSMTLYLWRQGTATKSKLRTVRTKGRAVAYYEDDVIAWAKKHDVPFAVHPRGIHIHMKRKPGPKPRVAVAA